MSSIRYVLANLQNARAALSQVSRAGFYRYLDCRAPEEQDMAVRSSIQEMALEHGRHYGYRRVTAELSRVSEEARRMRVPPVQKYGLSLRAALSSLCVGGNGWQMLKC